MQEMEETWICSLGREDPPEGSPLQYSRLENPLDRGAWWAAVHGVTQRQTGPLLLLPLIPPSIRVFSNESILHMRWPKDWSFSFSLILSKEIPGLISMEKGKKPGLVLVIFYLP